MKHCDISSPLVSPQRQHETLINPKYRVSGLILLRFLSAFSGQNRKFLAGSAGRISDEMYGTDTPFAFEFANRYTKPTYNTFLPSATPAELISARDELKSKLKLTLMLRSDRTKPPKISPGDLVEVYVLDNNGKLGTFLTSRTMITYKNLRALPGTRENWKSHIRGCRRCTNYSYQ